MIEAILDRGAYRVLNDGPGRWVLVHEDWEECPVFATEAEAWAYVDYLLSD